MPLPQAPLLGWMTKENDAELSECYDIHEDEEHLIGRDGKSCSVVLTDATISNWHLRIYSIIYDSSVVPVLCFTYAEDLSSNGSYWLYETDGHWQEYLIGKGHAVLLSDGDRVRLCDGSCFVFSFSASCHLITHMEDDDNQAEMDMDDFYREQVKDMKSFANLYRVSRRVLGSGAYGRVLMAIDRFNQRQVACKIVPLRNHNRSRSQEEELSRKLWREVDILKHISHPNIIHVERIFYTENTLYIIEDLITGGDLMSYIDGQGNAIEDAEACFITYQIVKALEHLHGEKIAHRDIKPENILLDKPFVGARVILTDFGHAFKLTEPIKTRRNRMKTMNVGTSYYVAPEVRSTTTMASQKGYTVAADMWSLGVLATMLVTGNCILNSTQDTGDDHISATAIVDAAKAGILNSLDCSSLWQRASKQAIAFVKELLALDENARLQADQSLQHRWFTEPERQILLQHMYERATKGWKKTIPLLDFKEDLKVFEEVHKYKTDADMMPPPKKQASSNKRPGPRDISRDEEHHLRLQVSREQSGFRSAKSFGKSIEGEKRKLRG